MNRYEGGSRELLSRFEEIYSLLKDVYAATEGRYPALEWVHDKPWPGEEGWEERFREIYAPFLRWRLENELDEIITMEDDAIKALIGINYVRDPEIFQEYRRLFQAVGEELSPNSAFLEILAVHPAEWRKGLGRLLLKRAMEEIRMRGKKGYGITFPDLYPALSLYDSMGAKVLGKVEGFMWNEGDKPADYLLIRFI